MPWYEKYLWIIIGAAAGLILCMIVTCCIIKLCCKGSSNKVSTDVQQEVEVFPVVHKPSKEPNSRNIPPIDSSRNDVTDVSIGNITGRIMLPKKGDK